MTASKCCLTLSKSSDEIDFHSSLAFHLITRTILFEFCGSIHTSLPKGVEQYENVFLLNPADEIKLLYSGSSDRQLNLVYQYQERAIDIKLYKAKS